MSSGQRRFQVDCVICGRKTSRHKYCEKCASSDTVKRKYLASQASPPSVLKGDYREPQTRYDFLLKPEYTNEVL